MVFGLVALWLGWRWALRKCEAANVADWGNRWINRLDGLNRLFCRHFHRLGRQSIEFIGLIPAAPFKLLGSFEPCS